MKFQTEVITDRPRLAVLEPEWNSLLRSSSANHLFLTWEWITTWLDATHPAARPFVVALRDEEGHLVGIAPFYRGALRLLGVVRYGCLRVLGDQDSGAEYPDVIVRRGSEPVVLDALMDVLGNRPRVWDSIWLPRRGGWCGTRELLRDSAVRRKIFFRERSRSFSSVALPASYDDYFAGLSAKKRSNIRREAKSLERKHRVSVERCESPEQLREFLPVFFELHQKRWNAASQEGSFDRKPLARRFFEGFAPVALRCGWLRLYVLRLDGVIRAAQFGYAYDGVLYQMQEGYDPAAGSGVGNVLRANVVRRCVEEGLKEYDFLGGLAEHKHYWGAEPRQGCDLFLVRRSLKAEPLLRNQLWPSGRFLRPESLFSRSNGWQSDP